MTRTDNMSPYLSTQDNTYILGIISLNFSIIIIRQIEKYLEINVLKE